MVRPCIEINIDKDEYYLVTNKRKQKISKRLMGDVLKDLKTVKYIPKSKNIRVIEDERVIKRLYNHKVCRNIMYIGAVSGIASVLAISNINTDVEAEPIKSVYIKEVEDNDNIAYSNVSEEEIITPVYEEIKYINEYLFSYEDRSSSEEMEYVKNNFSSLASKYAELYGIDEELILAIIAQENPYNTLNESSVGARGVMQIESVWWGSEINAYNMSDEKYDYTLVDENSLYNPDVAIKTGVMILNNYYNYIYYNYVSNNILTEEECIIASLISYNKGINSICNLIDCYGNNYLDYIYLTNGGDDQYIDHVLSYLENDSTITFKASNGSITQLYVHNNCLSR